VRMEARFYAGDATAGLRAAERLGGNDLIVAKARAAVLAKARNAKALLDAVPAASQREPGYIFARVQWLRQNNKPEEAGKLILTAPKDPEALVDLDQWWLERRLLVRTLLDQHNPQAAYNVAREAAPPMRGVYRVDAHFTAGCATCTIRRLLHSTSRTLWKAPTIRMHYRAAAIGRAAPQRRWVKMRRPRLFTRWPGNTLQLTTASLHALDSGSRMSGCAHRLPSRRKKQTC